MIRFVESGFLPVQSDNEIWTSQIKESMVLNMIMDRFYKKELRDLSFTYFQWYGKTQVTSYKLKT